uniref:Glycogenin 2 n=1 Tax=Sinocyclocheilus anshuiensis TaxID=1608454 RepID=A0A671KQ90_9TELE
VIVSPLCRPERRDKNIKRVLCNVELFEYEGLSAAPDPGWPDCFNSVVFVFRPSLNTHIQIMEHTAQHGSFDGGDQGVLNTFFTFQQYGHHAKFVHFLGGTKPWHLSYDPQAANESSFRHSIKNFQQFINLWFISDLSLGFQKSSTEAHHREMMTPSPPLQDLTLDSLTIISSEIFLLSIISLCGELANWRPCLLRRCRAQKLCEKGTGERGAAAAETEVDDLEHRRMWEEGPADYMGKDTFNNIMRKHVYFSLLILCVCAGCVYEIM